MCEKCRKEPASVLSTVVNKDGDAEPTGVGEYQIERKIGAGGMGAVYAAKHRSTNQAVALKVMLPQIAATRDAVRRFLREINITKALHHENIVGLLDSGYANGAFFLCLEYCSGGSVHDLLKRSGGALGVDESLTVIFQVLDALEYAHNVKISDPRRDRKAPGGRGMIHRDIKPRNILLTKTGSRINAKLADFGLSKAFDLAGLSGLTCTGDIGGSPHFMSRQQVVNFKYAKHDVDLWSTAATLYTMLTGAYARDFDDTKDPWQVVLESRSVPIRKRNPAIPKPLAEVIDHALKDDPEIAFKQARDLKRALEQSV